MAFETRISLPVRDLDRLVPILTRAGCLVLDQGERTTTEEGLASEATVHVLYLAEAAEQGLVDARA